MRLLPCRFFALAGFGPLLAFVTLLACSNDGGGGASGSSSSSGTSGTSGSAGSSTSGGAGASSTSGSTGTCDASLKTGLVAMQTGKSVDSVDCEILKWSAAYKEPDPMLFKALIYAESRFDNLSAGCPNKPCGSPAGWTADETGCYGLMQIVVACTQSLPDGVGLLPSGHPNMAKDPSSPDWAGSVFNPDVNVHIGIAGFHGNREEVQKLFPGCTDDQYTLGAMGNYAQHGSTKGCSVYNMDYAKNVLPAYKEYAAAARYTPHTY